jgi:hypothetical protein
MSEVNQKVFKGVWIPYEVWKLDALTWMEKCLWAEISFLGTEEKPCFASNAYLADVFKSTESSISNMISRLKKYEMIKYISNDGRSRQMIAVIPSIKPQKIIRKGKCMSEPSLHACVNPDFTQECNIDTRVVTKGDNPITPLNKEIANANDSEPAKEASLSVASKETPPAGAAIRPSPDCAAPLPELEANKAKVNQMFRRRDNTVWSDKERKALENTLGTTEEEWETLIEYYSHAGEEGYYCRTAPLTAMNNWAGEIDKSKLDKKRRQSAKPTSSETNKLAGGIAGREDEFWAWVHSKRPWEERRPVRAVPEEWVWDFLNGTKDEDLF